MKRNIDELNDSELRRLKQRLKRSRNIVTINDNKTITSEEKIEVEEEKTKENPLDSFYEAKKEIETIIEKNHQEISLKPAKENTIEETATEDNKTVLLNNTKENILLVETKLHDSFDKTKDKLKNSLKTIKVPDIHLPETNFDVKDFFNKIKNSFISLIQKLKNHKFSLPKLKKDPIDEKAADEPRPKASKKIFVFAIITSVVVFIGLCVLIGCLVFAGKLLEGKPEFHAEDLESPNSTIIIDAEGNEIVELGLYLRQNISYDEMPSCLIDAFLAVEDSRYFSHIGFDLPRFLKAALVNLSSGDFSQGGSTMTMQLVKNSYFQIDAGTDSTIADREGMSGVKRKMQEIVLAIEANYNLDKEQVIALFLNKINFGNNIRGIEKAAQYYFNKSATDLNLAESAFLAGIINAPNNYNPYNELYKNDGNNIYLNPDTEYLENAVKRRNEVLDLMLYHGYITEEEAELTKCIKMEDLLSGIPDKFNTYSEYYQSYIDAVIDEVIEETGKDPYTVPMKIYTNMDPYMQELVYNLQNQNTDLKYTRKKEQSAIVVMNNQTGALIALGGGTDQSEARQFNRATSANIQPGSAIKPILEYVLAFDRLGWATSHTVTDKPIYLYGSEVLIVNAGNQGYTGDMTVMEAIARSLNTPAILTLEELCEKFGEEEIIKYLNSIGIKATKDSFDLQWAIGGAQCMVTPVQLASAHAMLINDGMYVKGHTIDHIDYDDGTTYVADTVGTRVVSSAAAYLTAYCEAYNVSGPYFNYMQILKHDYPVYAKTGTTDWGSSGRSYKIPTGSPKDSWLVCQTNNYTITVWLGFDKLEEGAYFRYSDINYNLKGKWAKLLLNELEEHFDYNPQEIERPEEVVEIKHIKGAYPYCKPGGGYATITGLIDEKNANLISVNEIEKETIYGTLTGMSGVISEEDGSLTIYWHGFGSYADGMQDISASSITGKSTHAVGRCYFQRYVYINPDEYYGYIIHSDGYKEDFSSSEPSYTTYGSSGDTICGWTSASGDVVCGKVD